MKNDKTSAKRKLLRRTIFFEDSEDEGTSGGLQSFHDKEDINVETTMDPCSFQDKYAARSDQSFNDDDNIIVDSTIGDSFSFGQASYQRSKQGVIVKYEDAGDNEFQCIYCNAHFWLGEANKQNSRNAPIIYTGCCQQGQYDLSGTEGRALQMDLNRIAETADTSTKESLSYVLTESVMVLLRHPNCYISGYSSVVPKFSSYGANKYWKQLCYKERVKFETLVNGDNVNLQRSTSQRSTKEVQDNEYLVVKAGELETIYIFVRGIELLFTYSKN